MFSLQVVPWFVSCNIYFQSEGHKDNSYFSFIGAGSESARRKVEEDERLTARGLIVLVVWKKIIQSLFAGFRIFLLLGGRGRRKRAS